MPRNIKKEIKKHKNFSYLQKDFEAFRNELINYARQHYANKIVDFSEASLAGLFVDMAAYVGDSLSFYLDHQFNELFIDTAVEDINVERLIRLAGIKIRGPSPSLVEVSISMRIPAVFQNGDYVPNENFMPVIKSGTIFSSTPGVEFTLLDDIDLKKKNDVGAFMADIQVGNVASGRKILDFVMTRTGICTSAKTFSEVIGIANNVVPFRTISLSKTDVTEIISVIDADGDEYFEVESLTQDVVFKRFENTRTDFEAVPERLQIIPAPKRYTSSRSSTNGKTTIRFGAGNEEIFDEDIIPDPSLHAISLFGDRKTFTKVSIDPNSFLETNTLGIMPRNTDLTILYRHGGGLRTNVSAGQINTVKTLITTFGETVPFNIAGDIRLSTVVNNKMPSSGGEDEPTLEELKVAAILGKTAQSRIVTREDLIARVHNMPANLGRVYRVSVRDNPNNQLAAQLHVLTRNSEKKLVLASDTLKENLSIYLSQFRLVSDAVDILDGRIINIEVKYIVNVSNKFLPDTVLQKINGALIDYFKIENFQIDQPIIIGEVENIILNTLGVQSIMSLSFNNLYGAIGGKNYSLEIHPIKRNIDRGMIFPPRGGIFEVKYPNDNIIGRIG
mgnify:CR=1 FL=1